MEVLVEQMGSTMVLLSKKEMTMSLNRGGSITKEVTLILSYQGHKECTVFKVCDLGESNLIIGYTWLHRHNPEIDWETGKVEMTRCPRECNVAERRQKGIKKRR